MLIDIVRHRQIERQRQEIADNAQQSLDGFRVGEFKPQSASEIISELRRSLDEEDE